MHKYQENTQGLSSGTTTLGLKFVPRSINTLPKSSKTCKIYLLVDWNVQSTKFVLTLVSFVFLVED